MKFYRILILILCSYLLISCGGAEERKAVYLEKAKASLDAGNLDKARIELKNVLQIDPKDGEGYFMLGKVFEQQQDYRKAYGNYLKAEELAPGLLENHARLGRFYLLLMNDVDKAKEKVDLILSKDPDNAAGQLLKAAIALREKDTAQAIVIAENIIGTDPADVEAVTFLATLYTREKRNADAINVLDNAIKIKKDNEQLNKLLAAVLVNNKDYERAESIYKGFLERNPDNVTSYNNLAAFYNQIDKKGKAEEILLASINNNPDDVDRQLTLVKYIRDVKGNDAAINQLKTLVSSNNDQGKLRTALAELYLLNNDKQSAVDVYKQAINDFSEVATGINSRVALASVYISEKEIDKANDLIEDAIKISPNDPKINFIRAKIALNAKDYEKAIIALRIVTKETPENVEAYLLLANTYQQENNDEQVRSTLNSAYENNRTNADALLVLAQYYLNRDINQAEKIIDDYNHIKEANYEGLSIKAAILNQNKKYVEANKIAESLMELNPDKANGYIQAIPYYTQQKDIKTALSVLEKGYLNAKDNRQILILLSTLQTVDKQYDTVKQRLKAELEVKPDDAELKIMLAKVYMIDNESDLAEALLKQVVETNTKLEEPYLLLAQISQSKSHLDGVTSILEKGNSNVPSSIKIPLSLATIYENEKEYQKAINVYKNANKNNPDNLLLINNLASMLSDYGNKEDLQLAKTLVEKLKANIQPVFLDTIGWVDYKLGNYQDAIESLSQVIEKAPDVSIFNYHLGMAYKMSGNKEQAKVYLEKSIADNKQFKERPLAEAALKEL